MLRKISNQAYKILLCSFFTNAVSGIQFLVILNYFSFKDASIESLKFATLTLFLNRVGRFVAVTLNFNNSSVLNKFDHLIYTVCMLLSFGLLFISNDLSILIASLLLGIGMSGTTIAQKWRVTEFSSSKMNFDFTVSGIAGWGIGIIIPSVLTYFNSYQVTQLVQAVSLIAVILLSIEFSLNKPLINKSESPSEEKSNVKFDLVTDNFKFLNVLISAFIIACSASIFNSLVIGILKSKHGLNDLEVSLSLLFNLAGALILFPFPKIAQFKKILIGLAIANLLFLLTTIILLGSLPILILFMVLIILGALNTLSSTFQLDLINQLNNYKYNFKKLHVFTELAAIFGGLVVYLMSQLSFSHDIQLILFLFITLAVLILNLKQVKKMSIYHIRKVKSDDLPFLIELYDECFDPSIGQQKFPEDRKNHFKSDGNIIIPLNPPIDGYTELHYLIIEEDKKNKIGCITNLRNKEKEEEIGMLLTKNARSKGIGTNSLKQAVAIRKPYSKLISGLIANVNIACIRASVKAGAFIKIKNTNFTEIIFYKKGNN